MVMRLLSGMMGPSGYTWLKASDYRSQFYETKVEHLLIDVRSSGEYYAEHVAGAHLIPLDQFAAQAADLPKDKPIILVCHSGARSAQAAGYLTRQGFEKVYNLEGGTPACARAGLPIKHGMDA